MSVSTNSTRISPRQVQRDLKKWLKESGIESNLSPHVLKHTVRTRLYRLTKNLRLLQKQLGHSNSHITEVYADVLDEEVEEIINLLYV